VRTMWLVSLLWLCAVVLCVRLVSASAGAVVLVAFGRVFSVGRSPASPARVCRGRAPGAALNSAPGSQ